MLTSVGGMGNKSYSGNLHGGISEWTIGDKTCGEASTSFMGICRCSNDYWANNMENLGCCG